MMILLEKYNLTVIFLIIREYHSFLASSKPPINMYISSMRFQIKALICLKSLLVEMPSLHCDRVVFSLVLKLLWLLTWILGVVLKQIKLLHGHFLTLRILRKKN